MATYDYKCTDCDNEQLDVRQSIHDDALTTCEACGKETLRRIISSAGGFRIGGGGVMNPTAHLIINTKLGQKR